MSSNTTLRTRYRHVVSLGGTCRVAGILRSYGLRDGSYPFDWTTGSPEAVLLLVDSGFEGFMGAGALSLEDDVVCDTGAGVCLPNDFDLARPFGDQEDAVRARYARRVERFKAAASGPTLFVRRAWDDGELDWLSAHADEVLAVLRRGNPDNALVVVTGEPPANGSANALGLSGPVPVYGIDDPAFRSLLVRLRYPVHSRLKNLARHHGPILMRRVRAGLALRTRARRLAGRLRPGESAARSG
jgi:hypothetical protein